MDTIFALASAQGKAGVAIVRVSGPDAFEAGTRLARTLPEPRVAGIRKLVDADGSFLDEALVLRFDKGASFTGEPVVEFHLHGSLAVVQAVLRELGTYPDHRLAEPGEFTRRALENGRLDLTQVEALADLIESETEAQRQQALRVFSGALGEKVRRWRDDIVQAMALLEATIDFADEEVPVDVTEDVLLLIDRTEAAIAEELKGLSAAERVRSGFEIAIVGAPNAGKSTLLNHLVKRDASIVSDVPGTTRDVIEVRMDIGGYPVTFLDTAGLRVTSDRVEALGVELARKRAAAADLRVHLTLEGQEVSSEAVEGDIFKLAKQDVPVPDGISGMTGAGVEELLDEISVRLSNLSRGAGLVSRERHRTAMITGMEHLSSARSLARQGSEMYDIASEELRLAARGLQSLLGFVDVEEILGEIFASFCVGK